MFGKEKVELYRVAEAFESGFIEVSFISYIVILTEAEKNDEHR